MTASNVLENNVLLLVFNATAWVDYAQNTGTSPETNLNVALQTADPTDTGNMSTSEISYTSYARVAVARTGAGWVVTANSVSPAAQITFAASTGGAGGTVTHCSVGKTGAGAVETLFKGTVTPNIAVTTGVQPFLTTATTITAE